MKYRVNGVSVAVTEDEIITSGAVKVFRTEFEFDPSWDGFTKIAVFKRGHEIREKVLVNDGCDIPWEVLQIEIVGDLHVGVRGITGDAIRPTSWATPKTVQMGAIPGDKSKEPTPDIYQQLVKMLTVDVDKIENGHSVTFHDAEGKKTFDVMDGKDGAPGKNYVLTEADKREITENAVQLTVGKYVTVSPEKWSDDTDLLSKQSRAQRVAYKTSNSGSHVDIMTHNWNASTDTILSESWQTHEVTFTYLPTDYTGGLYLMFYGGKSDVFCHPYDISDVKLWLASDTECKNLFPDDIAKLNWWWHFDTESCLEVNRFSVAYDDDGHKYIHVWRQHPYTKANGKIENANLAYLRAGTGVKLTVGETYVLSVRMRTTCKQHTAIAECESIRDHSATVVSPVPTSTAAYLNNGVRAFGQRIGELMLKADTKPSDDITIGIQATRGQGTGVIINTAMPELMGTIDAALLNTIGSGEVS